ncbi:DUF58 domain-containing protein [Ornithobacterium rhinotracheale]|uniref:DUF58 domain-containing protein n=1 Tax=Ornithobacterium rhinotracheale TaxID=28251 RepID=A0A410JP33_ORNRH|nr:DUF58 domain-containing protein [Ornithobacterium rhinotracheale]QAR29886.1 DUF58 domain-containing protein [Ornithobacterium rhinotracheale]
MDAKELIKKVRRIEIKSRRASNHLFMGEYHSSFKGRGMIFSEVRPYQFGDDVRNIDWNKTAHFNEPYVKIFEEERELSLMLVVDISGSNQFGTRKQSKKDTMAEICATLAFSALSNNDKVGLLLFSDEVELYYPPKKGKHNVLKIIRALVEYEPKSTKTNICNALDFLIKTQKRKSLVFLISDFNDDCYQKSIQVLAKKHELTGIRVYDEKEEELPDIGWVHMHDIETGGEKFVNTSSKKVRRKYAENAQKHRNQFFSSLKNAGAGVVEIATDADYNRALLNYFRSHKNR